MDLHFTAKSVRKAEKQSGYSLYDIVGRNDMTSVNLLIQAGLNCSEDDADNVIDTYMQGGKELIDLRVEVIEQLEAQGFLFRKAGMTEKLKSRLAQMEEETPSQVVG